MTTIEDSAHTSSFLDGEIQYAGNDVLALERIALAQKLLTDIESRVEPAQGTPDTTDPISLYLRNIGKYPLLGHEEHEALAKIMETGTNARLILDAKPNDDEDVNIELLSEEAKLGDVAKQTFIKHNLRLVVNIAKRFPKDKGLDFLDLIQQGNLGLEHAVDKFDWRLGYTFSTYATKWIRQSISRALDQHSGPIRLPVHVGQPLHQAIRKQNADDTPIPSDLVEFLPLTKRVSLDVPLGDEANGVSFGALVPSNNPGTESEVMKAASRQKVIEIITDKLSSQEAFCLLANFGFTGDEQYTQQEIADMLGVKRQRVGQIISSAIRRLEQYPELVELLK